MRDHGGDLDAAQRRYGFGNWLDLSTGINPVSYPVPVLSAHAWRNLPTDSDMARLLKAACRYYQTDGQIIPFTGAQGAIQAIPFVCRVGQARVLSPTYNEHAAALRSGGWSVNEVADLRNLAGADLAVIVNPNNPDGRYYSRETFVSLAEKVGILVVDESFVDAHASDSLNGGILPNNVIILKSFGKFFGLAGLRLGFAIAQGTLGDRLKDRAGPWPVSGVAIEVAVAAYEDAKWQAESRTRLAYDAARLDVLALNVGWSLVGGTDLFRTYLVKDSEKAQNALAEHRIWSRIFPYSNNWIRLGLPEPERFDHVVRAFTALSGKI